MNYLQDPGIYLAYPKEWGIGETKTKTLQFVCKFRIESCWDGRAFEAFGDGNLEITGYLILFKKDGNLNEFAINALVDAFEWDGMSFESLEQGDWGDKLIQIVVAFEADQNGQERLKVKYINNRNRNPESGLKILPHKAAELDSKYGERLKALAENRGGVSISTEEDPWQ